MRLFSAIFLVLIIAISVNAQNIDDVPILPITYTRYDAENIDYDLFVMDVNSREVIYSVTTSDYDCPHGFSPDNRYFNYSTGGFSPDNQQGYITDMTTGDEFDLPYLVNAYWSPDSTRIAYIHEQYAGLDDTLYIYDLTLNSLIPEEIATASAFDSVRWTSNGLIFSARNNGISSVSIWNGNKLSQILEDILPEGSSPRTYIAPDGQHLIYQIRADDEHSNYYLVDIEVEEILQLDFDYDRISGIGWNPAGTYFSFIGDHNIVVYSLENNTQELINFGNSRYPESTSWSPDGSYLGYELHTEGSEDSVIELVEIVNNTPIRFSDYGFSWTANFQWIIDSQLVYNYRNDEIRDSSGNLFLYNIISRETIKLTESTDIRMSCQWD